MVSVSAAQRIASLPDTERMAFLATLSEDECHSLLHNWREFHARTEQIAPDGDWDIWMILAGRGFGKTRAGAEWVREQVNAGCKRIALVGETQKDLEEVMIEGDSGLMSVFPENETPDYRTKPVRIRFRTGAVALGYNATQPDQLRGPQFDVAWCDELAKWRYARQTWDQLQFGMRLGIHPRQLVTTTPRPIELVKAIIAGEEGKAVATRGRTLDNRANLAPTFLSKILARYEGTRLGRQELNAEILGDIPNALFTLSNIDLYREKGEVDSAGRAIDPSKLSRIVVSVDHAVSDTEESNEHGIIACGLSEDQKDGYVLEDASLHGSPQEWATQAIALFDKWEADAIVVEVNQGGDLVSNTLKSIRQNIPIREVRASRGKHVRAEPVSSMYQQGRVHHCGSFHELETQMCQMTSAGFEGDSSPDRLDALVWGISELFPMMTRPAPIPINYDIPDLRRVG